MEEGAPLSLPDFRGLCALSMLDLTYVILFNPQTLLHTFNPITITNLRAYKIEELFAERIVLPVAKHFPVSPKRTRGGAICFR